MTAKLCIYCFINVCLARFEVFIAVKIQVEVFWVVTPCGIVVGYQHLEDLAAPYLQGNYVFMCIIFFISVSVCSDFAR